MDEWVSGDTFSDDPMEAPTQPAMQAEPAADAAEVRKVCNCCRAALGLQESDWVTLRCNTGLKASVAGSHGPCSPSSGGTGGAGQYHHLTLSEGCCLCQYRQSPQDTP